MTQQAFFHRAISFVFASMITATLLSGIDTLAATEHAAHGVMAQTVRAATSA